MTTTTQVPAVIDWLLSAAQASAQLGAASPAVQVHDGPVLTDDELAEQLNLWIGWDQVNGTAEGMSASQAWPVLDHARTRDEDGTVTCTADAWTGSTTSRKARDACDQIVAGVELLLRGDGSTGPGDATMGGLVFWSAVDEFTWYPRQSADGAGCACVFKVSYRARLVTTGA